jgi:hypothetical protein
MLLSCFTRSTVFKTFSIGFSLSVLLFIIAKTLFRHPVEPHDIGTRENSGESWECARVGARRVGSDLPTKGHCRG